MLVWPGIISVVLGVGLPRLARGTVDESARKSFQALVPEERRGRVSMFMDSYVFALGALAGCLITGAVVLFGDQLSHSTASTIYLGIAALATALTIWAVIKMRSVYEVSLLNWRLKRRQRGANVLDKLEF
jgi:cytochrome c biogenesis protein CcdA